MVHITQFPSSGSSPAASQPHLFVKLVHGREELVLVLRLDNGRLGIRNALPDAAAARALRLPKLERKTLQGVGSVSSWKTSMRRRLKTVCPTGSAQPKERPEVQVVSVYSHAGPVKTPWPPKDVEKCKYCRSMEGGSGTLWFA